MIIKKIGFGNRNEAFVENRLGNSVNIIFSDDNNKGKTLVMQAMMFALGNEAIFPSGFNINDYYFYTEIEINNEIIKILRKDKQTFIIKGKEFYNFISLSELKKFFKKNKIVELPEIFKDTKNIIVDLSLFFQIFFIGQDNKNTSNIFNYGYYKKQDFISMLCSLNGYPLLSEFDENIDEIKADILSKKSEIKNIEKSMKLLKKNPKLSSYLDKYGDKKSFDKLVEEIKKINELISDRKRIRASETNRIAKLSNLIKELNSLNKTIEVGKLQCTDCKSENIIYANGEVQFEISNSYVREKILSSIKNEIDLREEIVEEYTLDINKEQEKLSRILESKPPKLEEIIFYVDEIRDNASNNNKLIELSNEIRQLEQKLLNKDISDNITLEQKKEMEKKIIEKMNKFYFEIDPTGKLKFEGLFTKAGITYSGSEKQEYYYSRTLALNEFLKHNFPIVMDCFRDGEISTLKEEKMIKIFQNLNKQVIISSTLKKEEYSTDKYSKFDNVNALDYSKHQDYKILNGESVEMFTKILKEFGIYC